MEKNTKKFLDNRCSVGYHLKDGTTYGMSKGFI